VASGQQVRVRTRTPTAMRCLYTRRELGMPVDDVRVVDVEPLTRELLLRAVETAPLHLASPVEAALVTLLMAQLATDPTTPLHLPWPRDDRASRLADRVIAEPASSLRDAVAGAGASRRTLERRFRSETGMTLAAWRRRARLLAAIGLMSDGATVTQAATTVGYATSSAFTTAFRAELGSSPRRFMAADRSGR
jgi:AraC-like DNA-binding protein